MKKIALAMIVKPCDKEAYHLDVCLNSIAPHVDALFITQAGKKKNKKVSEVIAHHKGKEFFYEWNDNFADARNFSFAQVPKEYDYIIWFDADDEVDNAEQIRSVISENESVDCFSLWYNYAFDEWNNPVVVHHKTRIIRNDGCVEWAGALHEDFKANRELVHKHVEGIVVNHKTDTDRIEDSKKRNVQVAKKMSKDLPDDPRSYWNTGNAYKANGEYAKSIKEFQKFLKMSKSDDEKYIANMRISEAYWALGDREIGLEYMQKALGLKPGYPDAYVAIGEMYYHLERYSDAILVLKQALTIEPPIYKIIVFNPMDYSFTPLKWLAYSYYAINQPMLAFECFKAMLKLTPKDKKLRELVKQMEVQASQYKAMLETYNRIKNLSKEEMRKELDAIPDEYKHAPMFCNLRNINFIKTESSGKEVVFMCGYTEREWNADAIHEGIGGSEEAVINLSKEMVKAGYEVTVYNNCGHKEQVFDGVTYKPFYSFNYRDKVDHLILWRHPKLLDYDINCENIYLDLHDVIPKAELNEKRVVKLKKIFVKSQFHRSLFENVSDEKFAVIPNGVDTTLFEEQIEKDPYLIVNTSSPDRSLSVLCKLFKRVKKEVPQAKCEWAYGFGVFDSVHSTDKNKMKWKQAVLDEMEDAGIINKDRVSHEEVAKMYKRARIFGYPTEFAEIDCISARKAQLAGAIPVTTDFGALNETVQYGVKVHSKKTKDNWAKPDQFDFSLEDKKAQNEWVNAVVGILKSEMDDQSEMIESMKQYNWEAIAIRWIKNF